MAFRRAIQKQHNIKRTEENITNHGRNRFESINNTALSAYKPNHLYDRQQKLKKVLVRLNKGRDDDIVEFLLSLGEDEYGHLLGMIEKSEVGYVIYNGLTIGMKHVHLAQAEFNKPSGKSKKASGAGNGRCKCYSRKGCPNCIKGKKKNNPNKMQMKNKRGRRQRK